MKYLFVGGPPRSGTTALVHYLNRHPAVLLCMERYKWLPAREVGPDLFSFERILDYRPRPRGDRLETNTPREYHEELLASKDPARLEWVGDKAPGYVERLGVLAENNPGASFILTYRPLEEVVESFEARSRDPGDPWLGGKDGFRIGVDHWNAAMRHTRDFVESAANLNVLVVSYHDFFSDREAVIPLLARFLGLEFGPEVREGWGEMSRGFEAGRRSKRALSEEQLAYLEANRDAGAERWVLERLCRQRRELETCPPELARALIEERRAAAVNLATERAKTRRLWRANESLKERNERLEASLRAAPRMEEPPRPGQGVSGPVRKGLGRLRAGRLYQNLSERARRLRVRSGVELVHGPGEVPLGDRELAVLCLVRDGKPYVETFVEHYLSLGARHLVFLDNGSTDGTVEALKGYENVTVLRTTLPFAEYKNTMRRYLIERYGRGRWTLSVDMDELFGWPYSGVVGLGELLGYLSGQGYTAVVGQMLDVFPEGPIGEEAERSLKEAHRFYDLSGVEVRDSRAGELGNVFANEDVKHLSGGIRKLLFGTPGVHLTKYPLVRLDGRIEPFYRSAHRVKNARVADFTCALLHYKFTGGFREQVRRAVREENYYARSAEYKKYQRVLAQNPVLVVKRETSRELGSVDELVGQGFLVVSEGYMEMVRRMEAARRAE